MGFRELAFKLKRKNNPPNVRQDDNMEHEPGALHAIMSKEAYAWFRFYPDTGRCDCYL